MNKFVNLVLLTSFVISIQCTNAQFLATDLVEAVLPLLPKINISLEVNLKKSEVIFKFYKNGNGSVTTEKDLTTETVKHENFDKTVPTVLIIYGWSTNESSSWVAPLKDELFKVGPHNVLYLDWSITADGSYNLSYAKSIQLGKITAEFIEASGVPPSKIHIVGFDLGSRIAAYTGKSIYEISGKKIDRMTAVDPAGPGWEQLPAEIRLNPTDADFVDVLNTIFYYEPKRIGHVHLQFNDGVNQPYCGLDLGFACSHTKSIEYLANFIRNNATAIEVEYKLGNGKIILFSKPNGKKIDYGFYTDKSARGMYMLEKPFLS